MDGSYTLTHPEFAETALLAIDGEVFRHRIPPASERRVVCASHEEAVDSLNERLVELTEAGWTIADLHTASQRAEEARADEEPSPEEITAANLAAVARHEDDAVHIDATALDLETPETVDVLEQVFDEGCRKLYIEGIPPGEGPWFASVEPWCAALADVKSDELAAFVVDTSFQPLTRQAGVFCGDITHLFHNFPALRRVTVIGHATLEIFVHQNLEKLTLMGESLTADTVRAVLTGKAPNLEFLALGLGYEYGTEADAIDALIEIATAGTPLPIRELHLATPLESAKVLRAIASSALVEQVDVLCFHFTPYEEIVDAALEIADGLRGLETFGFSMDGRLAIDPDEELQRLADAVPGLADTDDAEFAVF